MNGSDKRLVATTFGKSEPSQRVALPEHEKMDLDAVSEGKPRAKWATAEQIHDRRENGKCLRCGALGHRIRFCRYAPATRPQNDIVVQTIETSSDETLN